MLAALFISVGENPRFCKRWVKQYPASLSDEFQSPTEIRAQNEVPFTMLQQTRTGNNEKDSFL